MSVTMAEKYSSFRRTLLVCLSCMFITFILYIYVQPFTGSSPYGTSMPVLQQAEEVPHARGLYRTSQHVDELNDNTYKVVLNSKSPTVVLYYASWCGHCRHFVKPFNRIADEFMEKVVTKNDKLDKTKKRNVKKFSLHFTAIDCAEYTDICSKAKVRGFPTLVAYNNGASQGEVVGATDKAAVKLINKVFFPDQEVEDALVAADTNSSTSSTPIAVAVHPADMRSYTASPQERFGDALASLDYLLTSELPYEWTEAHRLSLLGFVQVVVALFPSHTQEVADRLQVYRSIAEILQRDDTGPHRFLSDKIRSAVRDRPSYRPQWSVCGVVRSPTAAATATTYQLQQADSAQKDAARGRLRQRWLKERATTAKTGNLRLQSETTGPARNASSSSSALSSAGGGYPCGLWSLFHYLSVAAGSPQYAGAMGATELLGAVRGLVRDFFGCLHCREHFLAAYEACAFDRCSIAQGDYDKLQMWLFHQHNAVTYANWARSLPEQGGGSSYTDSLWPSRALCASCLQASSGNNSSSSGGSSSSGASEGYSVQMFNTDAVLAYMRTSYALSE